MLFAIWSFEWCVLFQMTLKPDLNCSFLLLFGGNERWLCDFSFLYCCCHVFKRGEAIVRKMKCGICEKQSWFFKEICREIGDSGVTSLSDALKVNSSLTQLYLKLSLLLNMINWLLLIHIPFWNNIGESGTTSLSEALKVNSSLTELELGVSLILNMINWLLLNHIPFITILVHQEQHHYQKDWRLIHHSLNWTWKWVYYWIWLIDYYWITLYF